MRFADRSTYNEQEKRICVTVSADFICFLPPHLFTRRPIECLDRSSQLNIVAPQLSRSEQILLYGYVTPDFRRIQRLWPDYAYTSSINLAGQH